MLADPLFWLALSLVLLALSLVSLVLAALPALRALGRAAHSTERLMNTLDRELPPTLEALRLTGQELTDLSDDLSDGVQRAGHIVQQVDQSLEVARYQAQTLHTGSKSLLVGVRAAWQVWRQGRDDSPRSRRPKKLSHQRSQLPPSPPTSPKNSPQNLERELPPGMDRKPIGDLPQPAPERSKSSQPQQSADPQGQPSILESSASEVLESSASDPWA